IEVGVGGEDGVDQRVPVALDRWEPDRQRDTREEHVLRHVLRLDGEQRLRRVVVDVERRLLVAAPDAVPVDLPDRSKNLAPKVLQSRYRDPGPRVQLEEAEWVRAPPRVRDLGAAAAVAEEGEVEDPAAGRVVHVALEPR